MRDSFESHIFFCNYFGVKSGVLNFNQKLAKTCKNTSVLYPFTMQDRKVFVRFCPFLVNIHPS